MRIVADRGLQPTYFGSLRAENLARVDEWDGFEVIRIGPYFPLLNGRRPLVYLRGVFLFNLALLSELRSRRPRLIHASDSETMPASVLYHLVTGVPLVFNIHDNLADRYCVGPAIRGVLNALEGSMVRLSDAALVPESFRRAALPKWCQHRVHVVRNSPEDTGWSPPTLAGGRRVRVLYAGWLDWGRGLSALIELANQHAWLEIIIAGDGDSDVVEAISRSSATFRGYLSHAEVMAATKQADFVAAFYDPVRPINRAAAPNKLAEAFSAGRPVLINEEVLVAQAPELAACTVRVPYANIASVAALVRAVTRSDEYAGMCRSARAVYESQYSWASIRQTLEEVLRRLDL